MLIDCAGEHGGAILQHHDGMPILAGHYATGDSLRFTRPARRIRRRRANCGVIMNIFGIISRRRLSCLMIVPMAFISWPLRGVVGPIWHSSLSAVRFSAI